MKLEDVLDHLQEPDKLKVLSSHWEESVETLPSDRPLFLDPAEFKTGREWGDLDPDIEPLLEKIADRIASDPAFLILAWHCHRLLFEKREYTDFLSWPTFNRALEGEGGVFHLLMILGMVPRIREFHESRNIPEEITRLTCTDIRIARERYQAITGGKLGTEIRLLHWFRGHTLGDLHRIGRMQYVVRPFRGKLRAFRNRETGEMLAISLSGVNFDKKGYVQIAGYTDGEGGWTSELGESQNEITGCPISPFGIAVRKKVTLSFDAWECVLNPEDPVLEMHIPEGEAMTPQRCLESMQEALEFFPKYFPDRPFVSFACYSWIFNPQLEEMLGQESNLVKYMSELYLFPIPTGGKSGLYFVFYHDDVDPKTSPRNTRLRRAYLDHLEAGKPLRSGAMFMLPDDLKYYGSQHYRSQWPITGLGVL